MSAQKGASLHNGMNVGDGILEPPNLNSNKHRCSDPEKPQSAPIAGEAVMGMLSFDLIFSRWPHHMWAHHSLNPLQSHWLKEDKENQENYKSILHSARLSTEERDMGMPASGASETAIMSASGQLPPSPTDSPSAPYNDVTE